MDIAWRSDVIVDVGHFGLGRIVRRFVVIPVRIGNPRLHFATKYERSAQL
jgi:hypothetical protein